MRVKTLEIRWHDGKPISSCHFQPLPPAQRKARQAKDKETQHQASYRLATAGDDNNVRVRLFPVDFAQQPGLNCV